jgi:hypothetical protein
MDKIASALVKAQKAFGPALKSATNPHFKSRYADLAACVEAVIDSLNANGIALMQRNIACDTGITIETVFVHESGEMLSSGPLHVPASKADAQGYGSAMTYARRYSLMAACGIAPEDDDGNAAAKKPAKKGGVVSDYLEAVNISQDRMDALDELALTVIDDFSAFGVESAHERIDMEKLPDEEKVYLWSKLPSNVRSALKSHARAVTK